MNSQEKRRTQIHRTPEQIQQLVAEYRRSGQPIGQFAHQQGVAISTVGRWLRKHRQPKAARLVEVQREPRHHSTHIGQLRLSRGLVLELERGFEAEPIARLVQLLEER